MKGFNVSSLLFTCIFFGNAFKVDGLMSRYELRARSAVILESIYNLSNILKKKLSLKN